MIVKMFWVINGKHGSTFDTCLDEEICLLNILLGFSPNDLFVIRLCTIVNWAGPKKL